MQNNNLVVIIKQYLKLILITHALPAVVDRSVIIIRKIIDRIEERFKIVLPCSRSSAVNLEPFTSVQS